MFTNAQIVMLVVVALLGHTMALFWYLADRRNARLCRKRIYDVPLPEGQLRRELLNSVHTPIHAVTLAVFLYYGFFRNTSVLARPVQVTWELDIRPAIYQVLAGDTLKDIQGVDNVTDPASILADGVWMNGPATGGWTTWGLQLREDLPKMMYDDGSNGDAVAGDSIYTVMFDYAPDSTGSRWRRY